MNNEMKTRAHADRERIGRAIHRVRKSACYSLTRHLNSVPIYSFQYALLCPKVCGYGKTYSPERHRNALADMYDGRYKPNTATILVNMNQTDDELCKTIVHELTHHTLATYSNEKYDIEEFYAQLAEKEYIKGAKIHVTRSCKKM